MCWLGFMGWVFGWHHSAKVIHLTTFIYLLSWVERSRKSFSHIFSTPACLHTAPLSEWTFAMELYVLCLVCQSVQLFRTPWTVARQAPLSIGFSRQEYWNGCHALLQRIFLPGIEPRSAALQADSLQPEPPGKPMNTGVGSLSLLQGNFPTQESNWDLLHCRQILYQLSYQGSPNLGGLTKLLT